MDILWYLYAARRRFEAELGKFTWACATVRHQAHGVSLTYKRDFPQRDEDCTFLRSLNLNSSVAAPSWGIRSLWKSPLFLFIPTHELSCPWARESAELPLWGILCPVLLFWVSLCESRKGAVCPQLCQGKQAEDIRVKKRVLLLSFLGLSVFPTVFSPFSRYSFNSFSQ